jgi:hypothetical protein
MKFEDVIQDIEKLAGKKIRSIRPGADIEIVSVNRKENQIRLVDAKGKERVRSVDELKRIWEHLCLHPATHVDAVLGGSGSSRNQPETIFANLPYIEVIYLSNKKHIAYTGRPSHPSGTTKEMDAIGAQKIRMAIEATKQILPAAIIIVDDPRPISTSLQGLSGLQSTSTAPGIYNHSFANKEVSVVSSVNVVPPIPSGTYIPVDTKSRPSGGSEVRIGSQSYYLITRNGINILARSEA